MKQLEFRLVRFDDKDILTQEFFDDLFQERYIEEKNVWVLNVEGIPVWMTITNDLYTLEFNIVGDESKFFTTASAIEDMFKYMDSYYQYTIEFNEALNKVMFNVYKEED